MVERTDGPDGMGWRPDGCKRRPQARGTGGGFEAWAQAKYSNQIRQPQQACQTPSNKFLVTSHKFQVNLSPLGGGFNLSPLGEV